MTGRILRFPPRERRRRIQARSPEARRQRSGLGRYLEYLVIPALLGALAVLSGSIEDIGTREISGAATVNDGDTLTLAGERVRLAGIDAPELAQSCMRDGAAYDCGRRAREALVELVEGQTVACSGWKRDRYGRLLVSCQVGGLDLNRAMVERGWAVAYGGYEDAERDARDQGAGLWAGSFDRPRDWRVQHGDMADTEHDLATSLWNWLAECLGLS